MACLQLGLMTRLLAKVAVFFVLFRGDEEIFICILAVENKMLCMHQAMTCVGDRESQPQPGLVAGERVQGLFSTCLRQVVCVVVLVVISVASRVGIGGYEGTGLRCR